VSSTLPLRHKLPLLISALLCVVVIALSWLAYDHLEHVLLGEAAERLDNGARQFSGMLHEQLLRIRRETTRLAREPAVLGYLTGASALQRNRADSVLAIGLNGTQQLIERTLWSRNGVRLLTVSKMTTAASGDADRSGSPREPSEAARAQSASEFREHDGRAYYDVTAPAVTPRGDTLGFVVETRTIMFGTRQNFGRLVGQDARMLLGNAAGDVWTDLSAVVRQAAGGLPLGEQASQRGIISVLDTVPDTPWALYISMSRRSAIAPARTFLLRAVLMALVIIIAGAAAAVLLSRSITRPLEEVTRAAEGIAAGDYTRRAAVRQNNEFGQLARSFNGMAERVAHATTELATHAAEAQATARDLESTNAELEKALNAIRKAREESEALEAQLRQAQRMEAIGQLAGGIAHDFNNLLTVITNYGAMLMADLPEGSTARTDAAEMIQAANRAAGLTRQLLAFSRRQVLQPQVVDVNLLAGNLEKMLRRLLRADIELETRFASTPNLVFADAGQLEQVLMNLVVNARDAMPDGGRITIETRSVSVAAGERKETVPPGNYVALIVADTGKGMDAATMDRIFDPFFTTKPVGKGTGLGLSTAYGIVEQSGGHIRVESEVGRGTTFTVYLPVTASKVKGAATAEAGLSASEQRHRILLVEDESSVRVIARRILESAGYAVVEAANGIEALRKIEPRPDAFALVLTDLVMPEMGGRELANRLRTLHPPPRVLFMSGYTEDASLRRHAGSEQTSLFLQKPFTTDSLTRKVSEALA